MTEKHSPHRIVIATCSALLAAVIILVTLILPAEYGWDPLGTGQILGLMGLSDEGNTALQTQGEPWRSDHQVFELAPFEALEYKYYLQQGAAMVFAWQADGEVLYDMHSEPEGAASGYAESFAKARDDHSNGNYTAPFTGIHGWYWQNRGTEDITIHLVAAGFFSHALEMRDGHTQRKNIE
ncbi:MAG: hypothetical protein HOC23_00390 [Halieaceae bacterium]|jgi:hypothetical protein|nr:hypothetical protein [Halieaceae bacterium]